MKKYMIMHIIMLCTYGSIIPAHSFKPHTAELQKSNSQETVSASSSYFENKRTIELNRTKRKKRLRKKRFEKVGKGIGIGLCIVTACIAPFWILGGIFYLATTGG